MMIEINSRKLGRKVSFSVPGKRYIFFDMSEDQNSPGTLGKQICDGGELMGNTMTYSGDNIKEFKNICKNWLNSFYKKYSWMCEKGD